MNVNPWLSPPAMLGAAAAFAAAAAWRVVTFSGFQNDHHVHLARAQQIILGDLPVRDFVDPGMPLMYLTSAAAWWLWGGSPGTELLVVALGFGIGAACTVLVVSRLTGSVLLAAGAALVEVLMSPRTYSYPKVLLYAAAACAIVAVSESPSRRRIWLAAAVTAIAFLFRHDHGAYIGVASAVAILLASRGGGWRPLMRRIGHFAGAVAVLCAPWLGFVAYHQGLAEYVASGLAFSRAESERNRGPITLPPLHVTPSEFVSVEPPFRPRARIEWRPQITDADRSAIERQYGLEPVDPADADNERDYHARRLSEAEVRAIVEDPHVADAQGLDRLADWSEQDALRARLSPARLRLGPGSTVPQNAYIWLLYVFHLLPLACIAVAWWRTRAGLTGSGHEWTSLTALAVLGILVNVGLLRGNLAVWLPDGIALPAILGAWLAAVAWRSGGSRLWRLPVRAAVVVLLTMTVAAVWRAGDVEAHVDRSRLGSDLSGRMSTLNAQLWGTHRAAGNTPSGVSNALLPFFDYLSRCTTHDDRLLMSQLYPDVFVLAERGFAAGHVAFLEGFYTSPPDQQLALGRLRRESVPFVLLIGSREDVFRDNFSLIQSYIDERYRLMAQFPVEDTDAVRVYVDTVRMPRGVDRGTGWPCFR